MNSEQILDLRNSVQQFVRLFGLLEQSVTPCGYSLSLSQVFALQELEKNTLTLSELASKLYLERSSVSRLVEELVKKEFIDRVQNENNRREVLLTITEKGTKTIEQVRKQSIHYYQSILNDLSEEEQETILKGFQTFTKSLQKHKEANT